MIALPYDGENLPSIIDPPRIPPAANIPMAREASFGRTVVISCISSVNSRLVHSSDLAYSECARISSDAISSIVAAIAPHAAAWSENRRISWL